MLLRQIRLIKSLDGKIAWKKRDSGAPVMELAGYPRASYSPSIKGDEIDSASSAALRLCSPKNFCSPIFFPKLFYPTSFFLFPWALFSFHGKHNLVWFSRYSSSETVT